MGIVFGSTGTKEPAFTLLSSSTTTAGSIPYEVRTYPPYFVAEYRDTFDDNDIKKDSKSFRVLANYIGVFSTPENEAAETIAVQ